MRLLLALLLCLASPAQAQVGFGGMLPGPGTVHTTGGGGGYTGPGDIVTYSMFWSTSYAYNAAYRGSNAFQACNALDANCVDIPTDATTGIPAVSTTNVGAVPCNDSTNICTIKTLYDQTGNGFTLTQATIARRLTLLATCTGLGAGIPCGTGTSARYSPAGSWTQAQPFTFFWVTNADVSSGVDRYLFSTVTTSQTAGHAFFGNDDIATVGNGGAVLHPASTDGAWHNNLGVVNGASSNMKVDATDNTGTLDSAAPSGVTLCVFDGDCGGYAPWLGKTAAIGIIPSSPSGGNLTSINSNSHSVLGF